MYISVSVSYLYINVTYVMAELNGTDFILHHFHFFSNIWLYGYFLVFSMHFICFSIFCKYIFLFLVKSHTFNTLF